MVMPSGALDVNSLKVLVKNESSTETSIPEGAVIGGMYYIDSVTTIPPKETAHSEFDESSLTSKILPSPNSGKTDYERNWLKNLMCSPCMSWT